MATGTTYRKTQSPRVLSKKSSKEGIVLLGPPVCGMDTICEQLDRSEHVAVVTALPVAPKKEMRERLFHIQQASASPVPLHHHNEQILKGINTDCVVFKQYPNNSESIQDFFHFCLDTNIYLSAVIVFAMSASTIEKKLHQRWICPFCATVSSMYLVRTKLMSRCPVCGRIAEYDKAGKQTYVSEQIERYRTVTLPVIEHFEKNYPKKVHVICAEQAITDILHSVAGILERSGIACASQTIRQHAKEAL